LKAEGEEVIKAEKAMWIAEWSMLNSEYNYRISEDKYKARKNPKDRILASNKEIAKDRAEANANFRTDFQNDS